MRNSKIGRIKQNFSTFVLKLWNQKIVKNKNFDWKTQNETFQLNFDQEFSVKKSNSFSYRIDFHDPILPIDFEAIKLIGFFGAWEKLSWCSCKYSCECCLNLLDLFIHFRLAISNRFHKGSTTFFHDWIHLFQEIQNSRIHETCTFQLILSRNKI